MPAEADESGYAKIQGVSIDAKAMTEAAWRQEVAQREAALKATKSRDAYPFLYEAGKARGSIPTTSFIAAPSMKPRTDDISRATSGIGGIGSC
ncbi:hypothetical protein [Burkholderia glumae]|uniref:hypothetical protein n=1 Tax=Burkholderia glumae TaxID=337 RepID=UPI003F499EB5